MNSWEIRREPPPLWDELCARTNSFFYSAAWHRILAHAFNAQTVYGWSEKEHAGLPITIFRAGLFRIGYSGFPVGGVLGIGALNVESLNDLCRCQAPTTIHCLRIPHSAFSAPLELALPARYSAETAIVDLQTWDPKHIPKLRRDINKSNASGLQIIDATSAADGQILYHIYRDTVRRHGGSLRYNEIYFSGLIELSKNEPNLRCLLALRDESVAGFLITARSGDVTYYLHSGTASDLRQYNPSDALLHAAITWAQSDGAREFNLMSSPIAQQSLIRYKEKWGGVTRQHTTYTLSLRLSGCMTFRAIERLYSLVR